MSQNINLFTALPPRAKQYLSPQQLLAIVISFITILLIISTLYYTSLLNKQSLFKQLDTIKNTLHSEMQELEKTKHTTETKSSNNSIILPKFSVYLEELAEITPYGVWLTNIQFSTIDDSLKLNGYALNFNLIPELLNNLEISQHLKRDISILNLTKTDDGKKGTGIYFQLNRNSKIN